MFGSGELGNFTTLIISNNHLNDLIKIITALEEHDIFKHVIGNIRSIITIDWKEII